MAFPSRSPVRVLAVADSDSYLKWSAATLQVLPSEWGRTQVIIDSPLRPSAAQIRSATGMAPQVLRRGQLLRRIRREQPDVLLLACTGPVVSALTDSSRLRGPGRPVLVTGLPGIGLPAHRRVLDLRSDCDLMLLHSRREIAEFSALRAESGLEIEFGLSTLPFLEPLIESPLNAGHDRPARGTTVFAAQATVPARRSEREQILLVLAGAGVNGHSPLVKLRGTGREEQTHRERWPYPQLAAELVAAGRLGPDALAFHTGAMAEVLPAAAGLATVSSTAALEAVAAAVPILIISDFGVDAGMINIVFEGSGCLGTLADLGRGHFFRPDAGWSAANYFHPVAENTALTQLRSLVSRRRAGNLSVVPHPGHRGWPAVRRRLRLLLPAPGRVVARIRLRRRPERDHTAPEPRPDRRLG